MSSQQWREEIKTTFSVLVTSFSVISVLAYNFAIFKRMFFSSLLRASMLNSVLCCLNWVSSFVFILSAIQVLSDHAAIRSEMDDHASYDKRSLVLCFVCLTYLLGFFSVSIIIGESHQESRESEGTEETKGQKKSPSKADPSTVLMYPLLGIAVTSSILLQFEQSWSAPVVVVASILLFASAIHQAKMYKSETQRNGEDFRGTLAGSTKILSNSDSVLQFNKVQARVDSYDKLFTGANSKVGEISSDESIEKRQKEYQLLVDSFYDLVTDFYEWGWGESFHFAKRFKGESFPSSIARAEHFLASKLQLSSQKKCLDMGCGVGGPMRQICRFSGATIEGITLNEYQVRVANRYNKQRGLDKKCHVVQGDFMKMPFEDESFDACYAIEATCHAPDKVKCFKEAFRVLKEGGLFTGYEWVVLNNTHYDKKNPEHVALKEGIEAGNGLPTLATPDEVASALKAAGFVVLEHFDVHDGDKDREGSIPWFDTLKGTMTVQGFRMTRMGRICTHMLVSFLELLTIAPKGSTRVSQILNATADDLVKAGEKEIFTPGYYFLAQKPVTGPKKIEN